MRIRKKKNIQTTQKNNTHNSLNHGLPVAPPTLLRHGSALAFGFFVENLTGGRVLAGF